MLDLKSDALQILRDEFTDLGLRYPRSADFFELYIDYQDLRSKLIQQRLRKVYLSAAVIAKSALLPEINQVALESIKRAFETGESLHAFLSDKSLQLKYRDGLLNDLKFHHLHLDSRPGRNGFVKRSSWLLLVWVEANDAYFIDIRDHDDDAIWTDAGLLDLVQRDFPKLLEDHEIAGALGLAYEPSKEERAQLRDKNVNVFVPLDGKVYAPPGGGTAVNGANMRHVITANATIKAMEEIEEKLHSPNGFVYKQIAQVFDSPVFKLISFAGNTEFTFEIVNTLQVLRFTLNSGTYDCVLGVSEELPERR